MVGAATLHLSRSSLAVARRLLSDGFRLSNKLLTFSVAFSLCSVRCRLLGWSQCAPRLIGQVSFLPFAGRTVGCTPLLGSPVFQRLLWFFHDVYPPPLALYCFARICALRADHSPASPPFELAMIFLNKALRMVGSV